MPKTNLNAPWEALAHEHPSGRWYVRDKNYEAVGVSMHPGIAREIAKLPDLIAENERLRKAMRAAYDDISLIKTRTCADTDLRDNARNILARAIGNTEAQSGG